MTAARDDIEFRSHGATLRAWLYRPDSPNGAGIVLAHGLSAVREMYLDRYAERFADHGFTVLVHDHFGFGASDGEPRQWPSPSVQMEGYRDAVTRLASEDAVDPTRVGIWGSSFSGGEVIILASEDLPIACAVAQVPAFNEGGAPLPAAGLAALLEVIGEGAPHLVLPATTDDPEGRGVIYEDGGHAWMTRVAAERAPSWRNELRVSALLEPFRPIDHVAAAQVPLLLIVAPDDRLTPAAPGIAAAADAPLVEVVTIGGGHFDAYEDGFEDAAGPATEFFLRHLT